jgi:hypothetical protein
MNINFTFIFGKTVPTIYINFTFIFYKTVPPIYINFTFIFYKTVPPIYINFTFNFNFLWNGTPNIYLFHNLNYFRVESLIASPSLFFPLAQLYSYL